MAALMKNNPPAKEDAPMVERMAKIGIVPGKDFDSEQARSGRGQGPRRSAQGRRWKRSWAISKQGGRIENGWVFPPRPAYTARITCIGR